RFRAQNHSSTTRQSDRVTASAPAWPIYSAGAPLLSIGSVSQNVQSLRCSYPTQNMASAQSPSTSVPYKKNPDSVPSASTRLCTTANSKFLNSAPPELHVQYSSGFPPAYPETRESLPAAHGKVCNAPYGSKRIQYGS